MTRALVVVAVGTDYHPFDRLIEWATQCASADSGYSWFVQHGHSALPAGITGAASLDVNSLQELFSRARAVVCHGGPGMIMEARSAGHVPIVVPRRPDLGEHVDEHQVRFCRRIANGGLINLVEHRAAFMPAVHTAVQSDRGHVSMATAPLETIQRLSLLVTELRSRRHS